MTDVLLPAEAPESATVSGRMEAKMRTRFQIRRAAVDLFRDHGFNAVTTEQIAARAGVTQRTLFRHFRTKDAILFDADGIVELYAETLTKHLAEQEPLEALRLSFLDTCAGYDQNAALFRANHQLILQSEMLQALARQRTGRIDQLFALAIDGRKELSYALPRPSLKARLAAAAVMGFVRTLMDAWLEEEIGGSMRDAAAAAWPTIETLLIESGSLRLAHVGPLPPEGR